MRKKVRVVLLIVALTVSLCVIVGSVHEKGLELIGLRVMANTDASVARGIPEIKIVVRGIPETKVDDKEQQLQDCATWAAMSLKEKKRAYKADPKRWSACLCEGEDCSLIDRYISGKL